MEVDVRSGTFFCVDFSESLFFIHAGRLSIPALSVFLSGAGALAFFSFKFVIQAGFVLLGLSLASFSFPFSHDGVVAFNLFFIQGGVDDEIVPFGSIGFGEVVFP